MTQFWQSQELVILSQNNIIFLKLVGERREREKEEKFSSVILALRILCNRLNNHHIGRVSLNSLFTRLDNFRIFFLFFFFS